MLIRLGYEIEFTFPSDTFTVALLNVHPSRRADLLEPDSILITPDVTRSEYVESFGTLCTRFVAPKGTVLIQNSTLIADTGLPDESPIGAGQISVDKLPSELLQFLLASRYCEVDRLSAFAWQQFGNCESGWACVEAISNWVHNNVTFGYPFARSTKTAFDVLTERNGVCRDFQHLAITLCRCMHIPARYATGYLGDIGVPAMDAPMDFSAWFEVYLGGRWWTCDARFNTPRIGRVLIATGRDAADVAITTSFGASCLNKFKIVTEELAPPLAQSVGQAVSPAYPSGASRFVPLTLQRQT
jgi:transglutaminase-like putative cysteine protease